VRWPIVAGETNMNANFHSLRYLALALSWIVVSTPAHAYIGPGAGLGAIGTLIAFVGAVLFALVGFVWYPVKRLLRKKQKAVAAPATPAAADAQAPRPDGETLSR
jgi:hypothetical protein